MIVICYLNIKKLRLSKKLTQKELAKKINISQGYLSLLEKNDEIKIKGMRLGLILDFCEALNAKVEDLVILDKEARE